MRLRVEGFCGARGRDKLVAEFFQRRVGSLPDGVAEPVGVGRPTRRGSGRGDARGTLAGLAAALLEAADPGFADAVLGGDGAAAQAAVAVGQHPHAKVE
jgi:hypothetical protein